MKRLTLGLVLAGLMLLLVPSGASAAGYDLFVGCDQASTSPQRTHECLTTDHMAAYFEASEETEYVVCFYLAGEFEPLDCDSPTLAEAEALYKNPFTIETPGKYEVAWFDAATEAELGEWELTVKSPPPPPPPAPPVVPPVVAPVVLPTVNLACLSAQRRVTKLKAKIRKAHGLQKAKLRGQLKKARAAVKAAC